MARLQTTQYGQRTSMTETESGPLATKSTWYYRSSSECVQKSCWPDLGAAAGQTLFKRFAYILKRPEVVCFSSSRSERRRIGSSHAIAGAVTIRSCTFWRTHPEPEARLSHVWALSPKKVRGRESETRRADPQASHENSPYHGAVTFVCSNILDHFAEVLPL